MLEVLLLHKGVGASVSPFPAFAEPTQSLSMGPCGHQRTPSTFKALSLGPTTAKMPDAGGEGLLWLSWQVNTDPQSTDWTAISVPIMMVQRALMEGETW